MIPITPTLDIHTLSILPYSSIVFTHSHPPLSFSFHRLTLLSPVLTANTFPLKLQLTLHATASTFNTVLFHYRKYADVQILTVLS